jgi:uncharacterized protein
MPSLCDVSFLLPLCHGGHEHHPVAQKHAETSAAAGEFVICRQSQLGLLRLLSNFAVMKASACTTDQAWQVYDTMMSDDRFVFRGEPARIESRLREFTRGFPFSPKLWQDAYLAAFAVEAGLRLVTLDRGFKKLSGLDCLVLEAE